MSIQISCAKADFDELTGTIGVTTPLYSAANIMGTSVITRVAFGNASGWVLVTPSDTYTEDDFTTDYPNAVKVGSIPI